MQFEHVHPKLRHRISLCLFAAITCGSLALASRQNEIQDTPQSDTPTPQSEAPESSETTEGADGQVASPDETSVESSEEQEQAIAAPAEEPVNVAEEPATIPADIPVEETNGQIFETIDGQTERRGTDDELVTLNFQDEKIEAVIEYIVKWTGKTVMLRLTQIAPMKITLVNDVPISKHEALDLLFQAFRLNGVGVVENDKVIMIDNLDQESIRKLQPGVVLGPEVDVMMLPENGNVVIKVFRLEHARSVDVYDRLESTLPSYASLTADANSNQLILEGDIGLAKQIQRLIYLLDVPPYLAVRTETFRLAYADAQTVADIVLELFSSTPGSASSGSSSRRTPTQQRSSQRSGNSGNQAVPQVGVSEQLQVSVLPQINSVTVRAEPDILNDIRFLIDNAWDIPPSNEGDIFRLYDLEYTDPVKVKNLLSELLETGGGGGGGARGGAGRGGAASGGADIAVADIFRIEAYPDSNRLVIISKTPDNFLWLDEMIAAIDKPLDVGMPKNIELKYASAIEVSDILNALLAQSGGGGRGIQAPEEGLGGINFESAGTGTGDTATSGGATEEITFPWQSGRGANAEESAEVSGLVGKSRVVPNPGQNSLLVLATPEIQTAVLSIIEDLDRPGRQVMISAVLAEVTLADGLSLGIRTGTGISASGDNSIGGTIGLNLTKGDEGNGLGLPGENFAGPWFDTSFLDVNTSVNVVLDALAELNETRVLQRPRVFTSDNKEAVFFSGQDVTFQTGETTGEGGSTTSSYEQRAIGVGINVRPRITADKNVAMQVQILLSDINPTLSAAFGSSGNPVVNRRETTTTITVMNNQTIVISGIRFESEADVERKIPLLGDIPVLGNVFKSTDKSKEIKELLVFITPSVVDNPNENNSNFNVDMRERLDELSQPLKELQKTLEEDLNDNDDSDDDFFDHLGGQDLQLRGHESSEKPETTTESPVENTDPIASSADPKSNGKAG